MQLGTTKAFTLVKKNMPIKVLSNPFLAAKLKNQCCGSSEKIAWVVLLKKAHLVENMIKNWT